MPDGKFLRSISVFDTGLSAAEWAWRIFSLLFIGASGTITALLAKADPVLKELGPIYWVAAGLLTSVIVVAVFFIFKQATLKQAQSDFVRAMATPRSSINPLSESFKDSVIPIEDLRLPTMQLHENKHFKRCKFVGPAAIAIIGGTYKNCHFNDCGDMVAFPEDVTLTGIIVLKNCTVEECDFIRTTIFTDQVTAKSFAAVPGANIKGIRGT